ncbi:hypothetical protein [Streptomyces sp. enrichment culture]|uniref:hypothetical protein n=1 Tax=Streptomyces sp. enrichment culture TaxID=1795815 RepID=UPI003F55A9BA
MADVFELVVELDLHDALTEQELVELRWHLGLGPRPRTLRIVTGFPVVVEDEQGDCAVEERPEPLLACHGAAFKAGGTLASALVPRPGAADRGGWTLTSRQEIHPDDFEATGELLAWLAARAADDVQRADGAVPLGWIRFYEDPRPEPLVVRDGVVQWPS